MCYIYLKRILLCVMPCGMVCNLCAPLTLVRPLAPLTSRRRQHHSLLWVVRRHTLVLVMLLMLLWQCGSCPVFTIAPVDGRAAELV